MEMIKNAVFTACLCAMLTAAVQMFSPQRLKKELRLVCGLVLLICIAAQISGNNYSFDFEGESLSDDAIYLSYNESFEQTLISQTEQSISDKLSQELQSAGIVAEKISIVCTLDEYNYVEVERATIYLSDSEQSGSAEEIAKGLLPDSEIEVLSDWQEYSAE